MAKLEQHEALLDLECIPTADEGARFYNRAHSDFPVVDIDFVRWIHMGQPDQIVVTIRPVTTGQSPPPMGMRGRIVDDIAPHGA